MSNYNLYVGVDISAKTATVSWGCKSDDLSGPITIKQHRTGWQKLVDKNWSINLCPKLIPRKLVW